MRNRGCLSLSNFFSKWAKLSGASHPIIFNKDMGVQNLN